jgi:hypothetical protein
MKRLIRLSISLVLVTLLGACGSYRSTTQVDGVSFIEISGLPHGEQVMIDGQPVGTLGDDLKSFDLNGRTVTRIEVPPGTHEVVIEREGKIIVKRKIYLSDGNNAEVNLP